MGQIFEEDLYELGIALFSLYNGFSLTNEQLLLINTATDSEKIKAMELVSRERLKNYKNEKLNTYIKNLAYLKSLETIKNTSKTR